MKWHTLGCQGGDTDKNGRCKRCRNAYKNMNRNKHPALFSPTPVSIRAPASTTPLISMFPSDERISVVVSDRLKTIDKKDTPKDPVLIKSAKLLGVNECDGIDVGKSKIFLVYVMCKNHRVI